MSRLLTSLLIFVPILFYGKAAHARLILIPLLGQQYILFQKSCTCYLGTDTVAMSAISTVSEKLHVLA